MKTIKRTLGWGAFCHKYDNYKGEKMQCPLCNVEMKFIQAGVSKKTGKPYHPFYSCPECNQTVNLGEGEEVPNRPKVIMQPVPVNGNKTNTDSMLLSYAKDIVLAMLEKDLITANIIEEIEAVYKRLKTIL